MRIIQTPELCWLLVFIVTSTAPLPAQTLFVPGGTIGTSTTSGVGIGAANPTVQLSLGIPVQAKMLALHDNPSAWYGFGIQAGQMRLQVGNSAARFSFFAGDSSEIVTFLGSGSVGIGTVSPVQKLDVVGGIRASGEIQSTSTNAFRMVGGNYGLLFRNDGASSFLLLTNSGDPFGSWNSLRPLSIGNTTGNVGLGNNVLYVEHAGNVGIGTVTPSHKLAVNGTIKAKEVIVETTGWPDYVFASDYRLAPLNEVEAHIKNQGHLPGIPSAREVAGQGVSVGDMQARLLAKIEELTLHLIEQEKAMQALQGRNLALEQIIMDLAKKEQPAF